MLIIQEDYYPIVIVQFEGAATVEDTEKYLSRFNNWLSQSQLFGLIVHQATENTETEQTQVAMSEL
jgi:DNA gyrase inhibitor GyrI